MLARTFRRLAAPLLLLLAAPAPAEEPAPLSLVRPALWKLSDADTTIWLFGTIHVLPKELQWENPVLRQAFDQADTLVIETVMDKDPAKAAQLLLKMGRSPGLPPLAERVPADKRDLLARTIARGSIPASALDAMETWTAALMLVGITLDELGLKGGSGVEDVVEKRFAAAGKKVEGLEAPEEQLGYLDRLPEPDQRLFLATLLDDPATARADYDAMLRAWSSGNEAGIAATFDDDLDDSPALRDALLTRRNAKWAERIAALLDRPGRIMVAVGAGHLAGDGSVRDLLAARGLKVERVQ